MCHKEVKIGNRLQIVETSLRGETARIPSFIPSFVMCNKEGQEIVGDRLSGQWTGPLGEAKMEGSREYTTSEVEEEMYRYCRHLEQKDASTHTER